MPQICIIKRKNQANYASRKRDGPNRNKDVDALQAAAKDSKFQGYTHILVQQVSHSSLPDGDQKGHVTAHLKNRDLLDKDQHHVCHIYLNRATDDKIWDKPIDDPANYAWISLDKWKAGDWSSLERGSDAVETIERVPDEFESLEMDSEAEENEEGAGEKRTERGLDAI
ncbi:hypothetical protein K491DRAFT_713169 [Lophiostoma macrostomum CBS 122681]|uniref:Uncharacterized protein n=1 Tax=Lophiostoma macrostomum CBS 122681 TaxID=1314788 RepID=A0A6A6TJY0_9PLEO|nr:hypothetical protein K491DRAFT_713169 [Lophiostoma macrostomum CBS 122681]